MALLEGCCFVGFVLLVLLLDLFAVLVYVGFMARLFVYVACA